MRRLTFAAPTLALAAALISSCNKSTSETTIDVTPHNLESIPAKPLNLATTTIDCIMREIATVFHKRKPAANGLGNLAIISVSQDTGDLHATISNDIRDKCLNTKIQLVVTKTSTAFKKNWKTDSLSELSIGPTTELSNGKNTVFITTLKRLSDNIEANTFDSENVKALESLVVLAKKAGNGDEIAGARALGRALVNKLIEREGISMVSDYWVSEIYYSNTKKSVVASSWRRSDLVVIKMLGSSLNDGPSGQ